MTLQVFSFDPLTLYFQHDSHLISSKVKISAHVIQLIAVHATNRTRMTRVLSFFTKTSHCSVAGMLVRRVVTTNYWRRGGGGEHGGGGEEGGGGGGGAPPHIPAVMGSDVCVTSSPLLA